MEKSSKVTAIKGPSSDEIADGIRQQIRSSRLVPGQRLVEIDIIRRTGGSRFKVREAFQRLAAEGLVEIEEFRGARVRETSMDEVRQLYRARAALEGLCAADCSRKATEKERAQLLSLCQQMDECLENGSPELFGRLNAEWHSLIMRVSGNPVIESLVKRLNTPVHHLLFETFYRSHRLREAVRDHRQIVDAILAGDAGRAEAAMRQHIENGHRNLAALDQAMHLEQQEPEDRLR